MYHPQKKLGWWFPAVGQIACTVDKAAALVRSPASVFFKYEYLSSIFSLWNIRQQAMTPTLSMTGDTSNNRALQMFLVPNYSSITSTILCACSTDECLGKAKLMTCISLQIDMREQEGEQLSYTILRMLIPSRIPVTSATFQQFSEKMYTKIRFSHPSFTSDTV